MDYEMGEKITIKPNGGHRIDIIDGRIFLTDNSDERCEVNKDSNIAARGRTFDIPLVDGNFTVAGAEEAFIIAYYMNRPILAGARRFEIKQVWHD